VGPQPHGTTEQPRGEPPPEQSPRPDSPLQFRLGSLLVLSAAVALVFGLLRYAGVSARAAAVVLVVLVVGAVAGMGLIVAIFGPANRRPNR